jgi:hypothetical protein
MAAKALVQSTARRGERTVERVDDDGLLFVVPRHAVTGILTWAIRAHATLCALVVDTVLDTVVETY